MKKVGFFLFLTVYNLLLLLLIPFFPILKFWLRKRGKVSILPRFSPFPPERKRILLHVASVGELNSCRKLISALKEKLLLTTFTDYSLSLARKLFPDIPSRILPIDLFPITFLFLKLLKPEKILIYETEIWFSFLASAKILNIPVFFISGKIGEKNFKFLKFLSPFSKFLFSEFYFLAGSEKDKKRAEELGFKKVAVVGNLKLSVEEPKPCELELEGKRWVVFWGSLHGKEIDLALKVHEELKKDIPELLTIVAPRHPGKEKVKSKKACFRSKTKKVSKDCEVYVVDTVGELFSLYRFADVVVIGGSFLKGIGGHNPVEGVFWKKPVICGPYADSFKEVNKLLNVVEVSEEDLKDFLLKLYRDRDFYDRIKKSSFEKLSHHQRVLEKVLEWIGES